MGYAVSPVRGRWRPFWIALSRQTPEGVTDAQNHRALSCRAWSQLKMKVLALPMWRQPVGEGAKRTRTMNFSMVACLARPAAIHIFQITVCATRGPALRRRPRLLGG